MPNGLQSLATVRDDTKVRDKFIDDSLKSYNPDALSDFMPENDVIRPNRPLSVNIPPSIDPFSETPFNVSPFTGLEQDLSNIKIDAPIIDIATAIKNLKLDEGGDPNNPVSVYASNELQDPKKKEWEQETAVKLALLNNNLGALDFTKPNVIEHFKTFGINLESDTPSVNAGLESQSSRTAKHFETYGIDLEQRKKDWEARKKGGMPFINAGLALTQASRAGLNVPQALASAFAAFSATKAKLNELDPLMTKIALATLPKEGKGLGELQDLMFPDGSRKPFATKEEARFWDDIGLGPIPYEKSEEGKDLYTMFIDGKPVTKNMTKDQVAEFSIENPDAIIDRFGELDVTKQIAWRNKDGTISKGTNYDYAGVVSGIALKDRPELVNQSIRQGVLILENGDEIPTWVSDDDVLQAMEDMKNGIQPKHRPNEQGETLTFNSGENSFTYSRGGGSTSSLDAKSILENKIKTINSALDTTLKEQLIDNSAVADVIGLTDKVFDIVELLESKGLPAGGLASRANAAITGYLDGVGDLVSTWTGRNLDTGYAFADDDNNLETIDGKIVTRSKDEIFRAFQNKSGQFAKLGFDWESTPWYKTLREAGTKQELLERLVFDLGIKGAALSGQEGRALSDRDLMLFMRRMGGDAKSARHFRSNISDAIDSVLDSYVNRSHSRANVRIFGPVGFKQDSQGIDTKVLNEIFYNPLAEGGATALVEKTVDGRYTWKPEHMLDITDIKARLSDIKGDVTSSPSAAGTATLQKNAELIDNSLINLRIMTQGKYAKLLDLAVAVPDKNVVFSAANKGMQAVMQTPLAQEIINLDEVTLEKILELYQKEVIPRMALPNTQLSKIAKSSMHTAFLKYFVESSAQLGNFNELLQGYSDSAFIPMGVP